MIIIRIKMIPRYRVFVSITWHNSCDSLNITGHIRHTR